MKRSSLPLLAWEISVSIDAILLQKHVQTFFALNEWMSGQYVDKVLEPPSPVLYKVLLKNAIILVQEGHLFEVGLFGEWRDINLEKMK